MGGYDVAKRKKFIIYSQGEDTIPKMTMSERSVAVEDINQKVEDGIKSFEGFQKKLQCIIRALNAQHSSMIELNSNRLKTAKLLARSFTEDSPIAYITGEARTPPPITSAVDLTPCDPSLANSCRVTILGGGDFADEENADALLPTGAGEAAPGLVEESIHGSSSDGSHRTVISVELIESDHCTEASIKDDNIESGSTDDDTIDEVGGEKGDKEESPASNADIKKEDSNNEEENEVKDGGDDAASTSTGSTNLLGDDASKTVDRPKFSTVDVHLSAFQLGEDHARLFKTSVIDYVVEWHEIVTSRVKARVIEFTRLKANLVHYQKKVGGLAESAEKARRQAKTNATKQPAPTDTSLRGMFNSMAMTRSDSTRGKLEAQLDRNRLKLGGAREVFTMYGQSLILLIDEVVNRAWRDIFPVILHSINLDMHQSKIMASIFAASQVLASELELLGEEHAIDMQGRLQNVKELHPEEIYTGTESIVRPVLRSK